MKVILLVDFKLFLFEINDMNMSLGGKCRFSLVEWRRDSKSCVVRASIWHTHCHILGFSHLLEPKLNEKLVDDSVMGTKTLFGVLIGQRERSSSDSELDASRRLGSMTANRAF